MNKRYIQTIILTLALLMGAASETWALGESDIIIDPVSPTGGGTVVFKSITEKIEESVTVGWTVTITVTPAEGFLIQKENINVQKLQNLGQAQSRRRTPAIADALTVSGLEDSDVATDYTFDVPTGYAGALVRVTFTSKSIPGYYVLHQNGKGYLKVSGANVSLSNGDLKYGDLYNDDGNAFWVMTKEGFLQNNVYYLNVTPVSNELYLSVKPVTRWRQEEVTGENTHGKMHIKYNELYLCNEGDKITLSASPSAFYNACPVTITEKSWSGPTNGDLTVQSPQLVTYLRYYFTQKIDYEFYDDGGTKKSESGKDRRVYATLEYKPGTGGSDQGSKWDITDDGVIYLDKTQTSDKAVTATYKFLPADDEARKSHATATEKNIKLTIKPKPFTPVAADPSTPEVSKNYLLFSISGGVNYRYPFDDEIVVGNPVKSNGANTVLTDPVNNQISWKIEVDNNDCLNFKNVNTGRYLYYDESSGDYGKICVGATTLPSGDDLKKYQFRLFKTSHDDFGTCYYIIPYDRFFAFYSNDKWAGNIYTSLNVKNYQSDNSISLQKGNGDSQWCIYAYEWEYVLSDNFNITIKTTNMASATGNYLFSATTFYIQKIKGTPSKSNVETAFEVYDSEGHRSRETASLQYTWTLTGLDGYTTYSSVKNNDGSSTLTINVTSLPVSSVSGSINLKVRGGDANNATVRPYKTREKNIPFTIIGSAPAELTSISTLAGITDPNGTYKLTADIANASSDRPSVTTFSGILDCDGHTISGLNAPLFTTITNGTVRNVTLSGVDISQTGAVGAIASTANGGSRIYNVGILDGSLKSTGTSTSDNGTDCCGGIVGLLDGSARVINCFSYAEIKGGNRVGGIVGYNNYSTKSSDIRTMVMNCMFYGNISGGTSKAPIYNGKNISNAGETGVGNYNYFWLGSIFDNGINVYNCALSADTRYLQRFEFYRHLLNGHLNLAAWWATDNYNNKDKMMKWVMEPSQIGTATQFPILKTPGKYPSVVNYDAENATTQTERNKGGKLGELTVNIQMGSGGAVYGPPTGAVIKTNQLTLNILDKDPDHFNFNYYKVQLPYYNDVGTKNYNGNRVVTGWKITSITGGTAGSFTTGDDVTVSVDEETDEKTLITPYNFADRNCTNKDLYGTDGSNRVFNQGAYWDVPEGVTAITIEPYWAKCVYLADAYADVVYNTAMTSATNVPNVGGGQKYSNRNSYSIAGESQMVFISKGDAIATSNSGLFQGATGSSGHTVYDYAVVLVGNYHFYGSLDADVSKPYTVTSIDLDGDNEPDYSYILRFDARKAVHPVRIDFLNVPGLGMSQKSTGGTGSYNFGIMQPKDWFEVTNTALFRVTQFEYEQTDRAAKPLILHGGVIEQWVSGQSGGNGQRTTYIHVGSNVWFKEFHLGCHQDSKLVTKHPPVSVTGGDFNEFYLTGLYSSADNCDDNAECYINGGRFDTVAGTGIEGIGNASTHDNGNIFWQIQNADIEEFYGGGINAAKPIEGGITTVITDSHVKRFCGGPKFGDINPDRTVITTATNCTFGSFFGAGYGGNSYNRAAPGNFTNKSNYEWNKWIAGTVKGNVSPTGSSAGNYPGGITYNGYKQDYISAFGGVSTRFDYQFLPQSDNVNNVARLFIDFVKFSLATTRNVTSTLTGCTITGNFYGGGSLGKVDGDVTSTLTDCTVRGSVFGGGYDATRPTVQVMSTDGFTTPPEYNTNTGAFSPAAEPYNTSIEYTWEQSETVNSTATAIDKDDHILYTEEDLTTLGQVTGDVILNISGNTLVEGLAVDYEGNLTGGDRGGVFGGGDASAVLGNTTVTINATALQTGAAYNAYSVYGGGNSASVGGNSTVTLQGNTQVLGNVFGGGNRGVVSGNATVNIAE